MLISFKVSNFLSFQEMTTFSLVGGRVKMFDNRLKQIDDKLKVLSFSAIYGPNASGKTNFVKAIREFGFRVLKNARKRFFDCSYAGETDSSRKPSYFEATFSFKENIYIYGFEYIYETNSFISEWFFKIIDGEEVRVFERNIEKGSIEFDGSIEEKDEKRFSILCEDLAFDGKTLLANYVFNSLNKITSADLEEIASVYKWVRIDLEVTLPDEELTTPDYYLEGSKLNELSNLLKRYGTGIKKLDTQLLSEVEVREALSDDLIQRVKDDLGGEKGSDRVVYLRSDKNLFFVSKNRKGIIEYSKILFVHEFKGKDSVLTMGDESDGTIRIMQLAPILLTRSKNKTFFVDEFDRCLHPLLSVHFIEEFMELASSKNNNNQLIITTHESLLMDLELLRRDEIWFVEKKDGASDLYSLDAFQERFDKRINKNYLIGRYGSVPVFQDTMGNICTDERKNK